MKMKERDISENLIRNRGKAWNVRMKKMDGADESIETF